MSSDPPTEPSTVVAPGVLVVMPNGKEARVSLLSGRSALVGVLEDAVWHPIDSLKVAPT